MKWLQQRRRHRVFSSVRRKSGACAQRDRSARGTGPLGIFHAFLNDSPPPYLPGTTEQVEWLHLLNTAPLIWRELFNYFDKDIRARFCTINGLCYKLRAEFISWTEQNYILNVISLRFFRNVLVLQARWIAELAPFRTTRHVMQLVQYLLYYFVLLELKKLSEL